MNRFFSLLSVVLLYCSTISAQLIKIDYNNPLWSFDYMREAWKNNMDFLEAEHRIQIDSIHVNQKFRDYYGQALMTVQTFNKSHTKAEAKRRTGRNNYPIRCERFYLEEFFG